MALVWDEQRELEKALARVAVLEAELATLQGKPKKTDDLSNLEVLLCLLWCPSHISLFSL
jgi:hypothetical protein